MNALLSNEIRWHYGKTLKTIQGIVEAFPDALWLEPHGDDYYVPCRIAYHLAVCIDGYIAGGFQDKDFASKVPYGRWIEAKAEDLPDKREFSSYLKDVMERAEQALSTLTDDDLAQPYEPARPWLGSTKLGMYLYALRELSDHTGELNKMLLEDGVADTVWIY